MVRRSVVSGAIIAGGGATRFGGRPKGLEVVGGRRILDRLVDTIEEALNTLPLLVANDARAADWRPDLRVVPDVLPGYGTLSGLLTGIREAPAPVLCVAWDMPFLTADLLRALAEGLDAHDAYLPASGGRRGLEPLCAAYGPACGPAIERSIAAGDLRAIGFHAHVRVGILSETAVRRCGVPERLFFNINTAEDLARAQELA
jgi:molybdopterin-guanine dinucleotide biosynthesis protein A